MSNDLYEILGISKNADAAEIKKAYRALAREHHPDANQGSAASEEKFKEVAVAYEVLSDPEKRAKYDQFGIDGLRTDGGFSQNGVSFDFNLSDLFESFFGGQGFSNNFSNQRSSNDVQAQVDVSLSEAAFGATKTISLRLDRTCSLCTGSGAKAGTSPSTCSTCAGAGMIQEVKQTFFGQMLAQSQCLTCSGFGTVIQDPCQECSGSGVVREDVSMEITIPAGVETGSRLRLTGQGPAGLRLTPPGDLYVLINVLSDSRFERHGDDLVGVQEISFLSAIFGTTIDIETLDKNETLHIPPGTKSGEVFRLRSHGMGRLRGRGRGDILMYVTVIIPSVKKLNDEQKDLLKSYALASGEEIQETHEHPTLFEKVKRAFT